VVKRLNNGLCASAPYLLGQDAETTAAVGFIGQGGLDSKHGALALHQRPVNE
jgi:hypothetical protein